MTAITNPAALATTTAARLLQLTNETIEDAVATRTRIATALLAKSSSTFQLRDLLAADVAASVWGRLLVAIRDLNPETDAAEIAKRLTEVRGDIADRLLTGSETTSTCAISNEAERYERETMRALLGSTQTLVKAFAAAAEAA
ncbi:hypothetical protein [Streptomyces chilikensis]|uniref:Uncharacterized protein n=1 Tax=Streptomyces chilikensis TaxID=1194079 RepID=A0ABV3EJ96_9ACTN